MVNYNDIAKIAQVSSTTVSHVINKTRFVSPETRDKVLKAMKDLNYKPNLLARSLATGVTHTIGLVISDIKNPFYPEIIQGVEELAVKSDYNIFLCNTDYDVEKGLKFIGALIRKKVDGIIIASSQADKFLFEELIESPTPFVLVDWNESNINVDSIYFDFESGIREAVKYLISLGHKKIYFISGPKYLKTASIRKNNFINIIKSFKDERISYKIIEGNHKIDGGINAAKEIEKEKDMPTSIICSNDLTAIGVMKTLQIDGICIPDKISIIGLDNIMLSEIVTPSLTTIALERYLIGKSAVELLINRIKNKKIPKQTKYFDTKLIVRESTFRVKNP
ncbi:MAG: LacI family transcriptional regulator [Actinobacteria bacterium]|nr:LacI family transcriptional regulator [Cyanobacteriota bacterium]MCL5770981.1 LacI family transcriptional regulator [Actinomycetota bacterium]